MNPNTLDNPNADQNGVKPTDMAVINPSDLVGRSFLLDGNEDGERFRAKIIEAIKTNDDNLRAEPERVKYRCSVNDDAYREIQSYNEILHHIEKDNNTEVVLVLVDNAKYVLNYWPDSVVNTVLSDFRNVKKINIQTLYNKIN
mgnify:CR=1 FL=1